MDEVADSIHEADEASLPADVADDASPPAEISAFTTQKRGVVYFSRIPPYMQPEKIRSLMEHFGDVGRVFLTPEDKTVAKRRKMEGGSRKRNYVDGWVEFESRKIAKRVAASLNGTTIGGKKRHNFYRDDLWSCEYLAKFKWEDIKEQEYYNRSVRKSRLDAAFAQARKENDAFIEGVEKSKLQRRMELKRGRGDAEEDRDDDKDNSREFSMVRRGASCSNGLLAKILG